ncbi:dihydroorotate dehydrogenase [Anoxybacter fermentans]|nr:dihydroorotate dehydrogenase [Anoxybacter fermentans]
MSRDLSIKLGRLILKNPILTASGTCGFGYELIPFLQELPGAIVLKGLTLEERKGNPTPRIAETPAGILNSIGLQNPGLRQFKEDVLPKLCNINTCLIANISGNTIEEYGILAEELSQLPEISAIEVNISCPNVKKGGIVFGTDPKEAYKVVRHVVEKSTVPVIAKLSPNVTDIREIALAVERAGADAISMINTLLGMKIDIKTGRPALGNIMGGLSGPAIRPIAVRMVYQTAQVVKIPIIGMGGIRNIEDVVEMLMAGASAVAIGTGTMIDPTLPSRLVRDLDEYCKQNNITDWKDIIGLALRRS